MRESVVEVLLVTPRGGKGWIIPKGKVEARLGPRKSAAREAEEEGGVRGKVDAAPFGEYRHGGGEDGPLVAVFLMRVTRELSSWHEDHERERRWAALDEVPRLVIDPGLAGLMRVAAAHLATHAPAEWPAAKGTRRGIRRFRLGIVLAAVLGMAAFAFLAG